VLVVGGSGAHRPVRTPPYRAPKVGLGREAHVSQPSRRWGQVTWELSTNGVA
jgi:hypothetical protein